MNPDESMPHSVSRRDALKTFGASAVALAAALLPSSLLGADAPPTPVEPAKPAAPAIPVANAPAVPKGPFTLPPLGYAYNALEPAIGAQTMELHHARHHQAYINNANLALKNSPELAALGAEGILRGIKKVSGSERVALINNVGGHLNHSLFWDILTPGGPKMPIGRFAGAISRDFESFDKLVAKLSEAATSRFGSGWAWVSVYNKKLSIYSTPNQDSPLLDGATPIVGIDVWEHAYYLNYVNRRADYVKAVLSLINWQKVDEKYVAALD